MRPALLLCLCSCALMTIVRTNAAAQVCVFDVPKDANLTLNVVTACAVAGCAQATLVLHADAVYTAPTAITVPLPHATHVLTLQSPQIVAL